MVPLLVPELEFQGSPATTAIKYLHFILSIRQKMRNIKQNPRTNWYEQTIVVLWHERRLSSPSCCLCDIFFAVNSSLCLILFTKPDYGLTCPVWSCFDDASSCDYDVFKPPPRPPPNTTRPSCSCLSRRAIRRSCGSVIKSIPLRLSWHCLHTSLFSPGGGRSLCTVCARARRRERKVERKHCETLRAHQYSTQLSHTKTKCGFAKCQRIVWRRSAVPERDFLRWAGGQGADVKDDQVEPTTTDDLR